MASLCFLGGLTQREASAAPYLSRERSGEVDEDHLKTCWGLAGGVVVGFVCSTLMAKGSRVRIPGIDLHTAHQAMQWQHPMCKIEDDCTDVSSATVFLKQKEEDWQKMLAQGQPSSPKKKKKHLILPSSPCQVISPYQQSTCMKFQRRSFIHVDC